MYDRGSVWCDRDQWLPFDPPGLRGRFGYPGRCWEVRWRDRLAWRLFCLVAHHDHASVVWRDFRWTRKAKETRWSYGAEGTPTTDTHLEATVAGSTEASDDQTP